MYKRKIDSPTAAISITINSVNDVPVANADAITTDEDTPAPIALTGSDADNDLLTFVVVDNPAHGSLSGTPPNLTYSPDLNYHGPDSFTFKANDGTVDSPTATISITVNSVNDAPVANAGSATTNEDTPVPITLTGSDIDNDPLTFAVVNLSVQRILRCRRPYAT